MLGCHWTRCSCIEALVLSLSRVQQGNENAMRHNEGGNWACSITKNGVYSFARKYTEEHSTGIRD